MINPKRYFVFIDPKAGGLAKDEDIKAPWIFDPDHKIDTAKYQQFENEHTTPADSIKICPLIGCECERADEQVGDMLCENCYR